MTAIAFDNVTKKYGAVTALDGVSFEVARGEMFGVIGPDGAGKTTAVRVACGLLTVDGGRVSVLGRDPLREHRAVTQAVGTSRKDSASMATSRSTRTSRFSPRFTASPGMAPRVTACSR